MSEFKVKCSLEGLRKSVFWRKNLNGFFEIDGKPLSDKQVRLLVEIGISRGYETEADFSDAEIKEILKGR